MIREHPREDSGDGDEITAPISSSVESDAASALARAVEALRARQSPLGWWKGELETNVTMDAEDLFLREFLGIRSPEQTEETARWIRSRQRDDGTWANFYEGPPDLSTTIEAYVALRLAGDAVESEHLRAAARFILASGGIESSRVFTRFWLALLGQWRWEDVPALPPELMLLPRWLPLNIYDFAAWARQSVVALSVVRAHHPVHPLGFDVEELRSGVVNEKREPLTTLAGRFQFLDSCLRVYERHPVGFIRRLALRRAEQWIVQRQEADGSWGGIQPPWVYSIIALRLQGYALGHPVVRLGLAGLDGFTIEDDAGRRIEACQSPVWDTALAVNALRDAGVPNDDPALLLAARYLLAEEVTTRGDWSVRRPQLSPGGWAFEFHNDNYPDVDDTAEVVLALHRCAADTAGALDRGVAWMEGMQCRDGGWASFDADNVQALCRQIPFCDFGELIDPPSADVTAHVVETLVALERPADVIDRGVAWLLRSQEEDGSWFGRWGANYVYGTGAVLPAIMRAGVGAEHPAVRRAVAWIEAHQNDDGGWGEDLRSYKDPSYRGRGVSTASQTAWALLGLLAAGERSRCVERGVGFLLCSQGADGSWAEPWFTGTGFPGDFYINYHLYRLIFPIMALGRYVNSGDARG